jgi:NhaP-type Na+/H+ or K+/H+ antiporter
LSQAIAKGPFADKYVARDLREIISSEAGANDGFGFPFLMLATYLIRYADVPGAGEDGLEARAEDVGRLGGGVGKALEVWAIETWLYVVLMSIVYGAVCGYGSCKIMKYALKK